MVNFFVRTAVEGDKEIRKRLKSEFKRLGVSVEEVAEASGIPKGTLDNIVSGRTESMKDVHIQAIWRSFPSLRFEYILTGRSIDSPVIQIFHPPGVKVDVEERKS